MKVLETGIDDLVEWLKKREEARVEDISQGIGYPKEVIEEWSKVLEEHDIVEIDYGLTGTKVKIKEDEEEKRTEAKEKLKKEKEEKFTCDDCGRSFGSQHGLDTHRGMMHRRGD